MTIRPILIFPDRRLQQAAPPVAGVGPEVLALMDDLAETMYAAPGVGLAAPQIGVAARVLVMDCAGEGEEPALLRLANPTILDRSETRMTREEGCLSLPEVLEEIRRPERVTVRFLDAGGNTVTREFSGLEAVCVQHEIDHLDGRLILDHLGMVKRRLLAERLRRRKRDARRGKSR